MPREIHYKTNTGTENTPTKGMEILSIYVGRMYGEKVWKWILNVLDQERKNTVTDQKLPIGMQLLEILDLMC